MDRGVVVSFDEAKGFGFVRARGYPKDVFVHASAVEGGARLRVGQIVRFLAEPTEKGPRATRVEPGRRSLTPSQFAAVGLIGAVVGGSAVLGMYVSGLWAWLGAVNATTAAVYAWDKHRALRQRRRVPELVLLGLALIGGSPAALLAMLTLRHKTRKLGFLLPFAAVVAAQGAFLLWWFKSPSGA